VTMLAAQRRGEEPDKVPRMGREQSLATRKATPPHG